MDSSHNKLYDMVSSMWGPNQPLDKWPEDGKPGGKHAHIMESRTAGGVDQSCAQPRQCPACCVENWQLALLLLPARRLSF